MSLSGYYFAFFRILEDSLKYKERVEQFIKDGKKGDMEYCQGYAKGSKSKADVVSRLNSTVKSQADSMKILYPSLNQNPMNREAIEKLLAESVNITSCPQENMPLRYSRSFNAPIDMGDIRAYKLELKLTYAFVCLRDKFVDLIGDNYDSSGVSDFVADFENPLHKIMKDLELLENLADEKGETFTIDSDLVERIAYDE